MRIDVHAHFYDEVYCDRMEKVGAPWLGGKIAPGAGVDERQLIELMDGAGIDKLVLSTGGSQPYRLNKEKAVAAARFGNDHYKEKVVKFGGRFEAFGSVPLPYVDKAIAEAGRCLDELGFRGINLGCSVFERPLDDPEFEPFWAEMDRRATVVFLHPLGIGGPMTDAYGLQWMVDGCYEDTTAGLRIALSGLVHRHPNVKIIVPHLGGTIPFLWQRIVDSVDRAQREMKYHPIEALKRMYYDTVNETPAALRCTCDAVGAGHVMLGTDWPYLAGPKFKRCVTYVQESGLAPKDVEAILDKNAKKL